MLFYLPYFFQFFCSLPAVGNSCDSIIKKSSYEIFLKDLYYKLQSLNMYPAREKNMLRWQKQLQSSNIIEKDFQLMNREEALATIHALILIHGPPGSPYEGYSFRVDYLHPDIPFKPPTVRFIDIPWSPFVDRESGRVCLNILQDDWTPALTMPKVILSIISLLRESTMPAQQSGMNIEAGAQMKISYAKFSEHARQISKVRHYKSQYKYKDEQKPPNHYPYEKVLKDGQFQQKVEQITKDPRMQIKKLNKIKNIVKKVSQKDHKAQRDDKDPSDNDDNDDPSCFYVKPSSRLNL